MSSVNSNVVGNYSDIIIAASKLKRAIEHFAALCNNEYSTSKVEALHLVVNIAAEAVPTTSGILCSVFMDIEGTNNKAPLTYFKDRLGMPPP